MSPSGRPRRAARTAAGITALPALAEEFRGAGLPTDITTTGPVETLFIAESTVKTHVKRVMSKLGYR